MRIGITLVFGLLISGFTAISQEYQLSKPLVRVYGNGFFEKRAFVLIDFRLEGAALHYTLDGTEPTIKSKKRWSPLYIKKNSILKVKAFKDGFLPSETVSYQFLKVNKRIPSISISPEAKKPYEGAGDKTLTDQKAGSLNFRDGNWLGYNQGPVTINLDLGKKKRVREIMLSTLVNPGSWIMPPSSITVFISKDSINYIETTLEIPALTGMTESAKKYYTLKPKIKGRYVRLIVNPLNELPDWHPGKGNAGWIFMDEIIIR